MKGHTFHIFAVPHPHQTPHVHPLPHMALAQPCWAHSQHVHVYRQSHTQTLPLLSWTGEGRKEKEFYLQFEAVEGSTKVDKFSRQREGELRGIALARDKGPG